MDNPSGTHVNNSNNRLNIVSGSKLVNPLNGLIGLFDLRRDRFSHITLNHHVCLIKRMNRHKFFSLLSSIKLSSLGLLFPPPSSY